MKTLLAPLFAPLLASLFAPLLAAGDSSAAPLAPACRVESKLCGDYLEARTCDVWVGACFANSETNEQGRQATMVWRFTEGSFKGVELAGLSAALFITARSTLGDRYHSPLPVRNVLLVDERASDAQKIALREFVALQTGEIGGNVIEEIATPITLKVDCCDKEGCAKFEAGEIAKIETRCLHSTDKVCGHEETFYPPLVTLAEKHAVYTVEHSVKGTLLGLAWVDRDSRSSFLGKFELETPTPARTVHPDEVKAR